MTAPEKMTALAPYKIIYDHAPTISYGILCTLILMLGVSVGVFWVLVHRCTTNRRWILLQEWARERGFKNRRIAPADLPPPIAILPAIVRISLTSSQGSSNGASLLQLEKGQARWNLLIRRMAGEWIPSGLRPAKQESSVLDELHLSTYPAYSTAERFHLLSADSAAARRLSKSIARALIPADIGLLLWGDWLVLDFTQRPFDPIEFGRMIALAEQVAGLLP